MDTTNVYPYIEGFPTSFDVLRRAYAGFVPRFEAHRRTIEEDLSDITEGAEAATEIEDALNTCPDPLVWLRQRTYYRSCTAFYCSIELLCAFLTLECDAFRTWPQVTAYYCRFFILQPLLNLMLATYVYHKSGYALLYYDGAKLRFKQSRSLPPMMRNAGSHEQCALRYSSQVGWASHDFSFALT